MVPHIATTLASLEGRPTPPRPVLFQLTLLTPPSSSEWRSVGPAEQKRLCHTALDDGEFWYSARLFSFLY